MQSTVIQPIYHRVISLCPSHLYTNPVKLNFILKVLTALAEQIAFMYIHSFIQQVFISSLSCIGHWSGDAIVNKVISLRILA